MNFDCKGLVFVKDIDISCNKIEIIDKEAIGFEEKLILVKSNMFDFSNRFYLNPKIRDENFEINELVNDLNDYFEPNFQSN